MEKSILGERPELPAEISLRAAMITNSHRVHWRFAVCIVATLLGLLCVVGCSKSTPAATAEGLWADAEFSRILLLNADGNGIYFTGATPAAGGVSFRALQGSSKTQEQETLKFSHADGELMLKLPPQVGDKITVAEKTTAGGSNLELIRLKPGTKLSALLEASAGSGLLALAGQEELSFDYKKQVDRTASSFAVTSSSRPVLHVYPFENGDKSYVLIHSTDTRAAYLATFRLSDGALELGAGANEATTLRFSLTSDNNRLAFREQR